MPEKTLENSLSALESDHGSSKGGNFLLNVGLTAEGVNLPESV